MYDKTLKNPALFTVTFDRDDLYLYLLYWWCEKLFRTSLVSIQPYNGIMVRLYNNLDLVNKEQVMLSYSRIDIFIIFGLG